MLSDAVTLSLSLSVKWVYFCRAGVVRYLLSVCRDNAVVNLCTVNGRSCLHIAALTDNVDLLHCLLHVKANCNLTVRFEVSVHSRVIFTDQYSSRTL